MNILLLVDNFTPDLGASSFRFEAIVKELANQGNKVEVIASYPNRIKSNNFKEFKYENVKIIRVKNRNEKKDIINRAINYLWYFVNSIKVGVKISKKSDLVIATSPQLLVGVSGAVISLLSRKPFLVDIRDLWPDIVLDMKVMKKINPIYIVLKILENFMYKKSSFLVYNSPGFEEYLNSKKNIKKKALITNGLDNYILENFKNKDPKVTKKKNYKILYAGNIGIAQNLKILIEFAKRLESKIEVVIIGQGSQEEDIKNEIKEKKIRNVEVKKAIPREQLFEEYEKADILFLQLKNIAMFKKTIPSKIFEYLATRKPIIYGLEGIGKKILKEEFKVKYYFKQDNLESLVETFYELENDIENNKYIMPDIIKLEKNYSRTNLSRNYVKIINDNFNKGI